MIRAERRLIRGKYYSGQHERMEEGVTVTLNNVCNVKPRLSRIIGPLSINFEKGEEERGNQGPCDQADESKGLNPSQHSEEEEQGMNIRSRADEEGPEKIVRHADYEYSDPKQHDSFQNGPSDQ